MYTPGMVPVVVAFLALVWGANFIFMKWAVEFLTPAQTVLFRLILGFVVVFLYALAARQLRTEHLRHWRHFIVMGCLASALYYWLFTVGTELLPSGIAGALSGVVPISALIAAAIFLPDERITGRKAIAIAIGFSGVILLSRPFEASLADTSIEGVLYMIAGSLSLGVSFVYARRFITPLKLRAGALTTYQLAFAVVIQWLFTDLDGAAAILDDQVALWGLIVGLGILGTGGAFLAYYFTIERLGAIRASSVTYLPPIVALFIGAVLVGEDIGISDYVGTALILTGVLMLHRRSGQGVRTR